MNHTELAQRVRQAALLEGDFLLRSGRRSKYYLDKYLFAAQPDILQAMGKEFAAYADDVDVIAGPELGAVSLAAATSIASGKPFAIVRKAKKDYGTSKLLEGAPVEGKRVLLVEDVGTTAGAALEAAATLQEAGAKIVRMVFALDRMEGARENVTTAGHEFQAILTRDDLGMN